MSVSSQSLGGFDLSFGVGGLSALGNAIFAEVEGLLLNRVVLANVSVLSSAEERLDALRVVAEGEEEVFL